MEIISLSFGILKYTLIILIVSVTASVIAKKLRSASGSDIDDEDETAAKADKNTKKRVPEKINESESLRGEKKRPKSGKKTEESSAKKGSNNVSMKIIDKDWKSNSPAPRAYQKRKIKKAPRIEVLNETLKNKNRK